MTRYVGYRLKRFVQEEKGITALETAIILIAFVVVAAVFAFTILSAGMFSTERGKEAIYADLAQVRSSMVVKGSVLALADETGITTTVDAIVFTIANAIGGEPVNLSTQDRALLIDYRDEQQNIAIPDWQLHWKTRNDTDDLLERGELAEITVPLSTTLDIPLSINRGFLLEITPPTGSILTIRRKIPAHIERVYDLQ